MKLSKTLILMLAAVLVFSVSVALAQEEMTKEQWQQQMNQLTQQRNELSGKMTSLTDEISRMSAESSKYDSDIKKAYDDLYALVGSDAVKAEAFANEIGAVEAKANELTRLSDADLMARSNEVTELGSSVAKLWENKLALIPDFWDRLTKLNDQVKSLQDALAAQVKVYTVGTWAKDRDCLWNISKKKDIYANPWMWPKIWQGNPDQIKDPDIIQPGWKLKIPQGTEMSAEEKAAAKKYYAKKAEAVVPAPAGQ